MGLIDKRKVRVHFNDGNQNHQYLDTELRCILGQVTGGSQELSKEFAGKVFLVNELYVGGFMWPLSKPDYKGDKVGYPILKIEDL